MESKIIKLKPGYILRELGGEFCLFYEVDSDEGSLLGLPSINETGVFLWTRLEQGACKEELVKAVMIECDLDEDDAEYEVNEVLAKLIHGKIIELNVEPNRKKTR